jgi:alpha-1,2-mannosyltransferase
MGAAVGVFATEQALRLRSVRRRFESIALALPGAVLLIAYNGVLFGRWSISNGHELGGEMAVRLSDVPANVVGALLSPSRGALFFYPILILVPFTIVSAWRASQSWERSAAVAGLLVLLVQLSLNRYSGGDTFFGPRLLIEPLMLASPLLARSVAMYSATRGNRFTTMLVTTGIVIHAIGAIVS